MEDIHQIQDILVKHYNKDCVVESISRLGGLTNKTFKVKTNIGDLIVRLPGEGTEALINRKDEKISTELACRLGIDTDLIYFDEVSGVKITKYINDPLTLSPELMKKDNNLKFVANILRTLHTSNVDTNISFNVFEMALSYENFILENKVSLFDNYERFKDKVFKIKQEIDELGILLAPCHNDPLCENWVMNSTGKLFLIDWEYAGMNDPLWDLADVSIEADLSNEKDELFLVEYYSRKISHKERKQFLANKIYLDYLWSLWGKTRVPFDSTMEEYAMIRFSRMIKNIEKMEKML